MRFCPYAQRTRLVLHEKGIKYETININLRDKPEWFFEKNPLGLVPALETPASEVIHESLITTPHIHKILVGKRMARMSQSQKLKLKKYFAELNEYLVNKRTKFFDGDSITMIDYMMWPLFERLEVISLQSCLDSTPEMDRAHAGGPSYQSHHVRCG